MATKKKITRPIKRKKFDLSLESEAHAPEIVAALTNLEFDHGWQLLKKIFESNIAILEGSILRKIDPETNEKLSEDECDRQRDKLAYLEELVNKPQEIIKRLTQHSPEMPEYDPYEKTPPIRTVIAGSGRKR